MCTQLLSVITFILLILIICFIICNCKTHCMSFPPEAYQDRHRTPGGSPSAPSDLYAVSYTISGEGDLLDYSQLRKLFKENSKNGIIWVEKPVTEKVNVSFGAVGDFISNGKLLKNWRYEPLYYKQKTAIKNTLFGHMSLINKSELYNTIKKLIPNGIKYLPKSYTVEEFEGILLEKGSTQNKGILLEKGSTLLEKGSTQNKGILLEKGSTQNNYAYSEESKNDIPSSGTTSKMMPIPSSGTTEPRWPLIVKKDNSQKQQGVIIINSKDEYFEAKKKLYKMELENAKILKKTPTYGMIISEYISNPLLIEDKKFHLRSYFLLSVISGIARCTVFPMNTYKIRTAKLPYVHGDWSNTDIHLTGGSFTDKRYNYMDILKKEYPNHFDIINKNLDDLNHVICMALTRANITHYPESYAGYHIYAPDIMFTDDYHPYLLELNNRPGFGQFGPDNGWAEYNKQFSYNFFSFVLNSTILPFFGFKRPIMHGAEFISNGTLTPFANILTGENKCILIPYIDATKDEINSISFFNKNILKECKNINIFLIGRHLNNYDFKIIGYLALTNKYFLKIAIIEEFQNCGIADAMIAQFLEIYYVRHFTIATSHKIYINNEANICIKKIGHKLHLNILFI